jgi:pilus assembly protein CpaF
VVSAVATAGVDEASRSPSGSTDRQIQHLRARVLEQLDSRLAAEMQLPQLRQHLELIVHGLAEQERLGLTAREQARLADELVNDMVGLGPLEILLADDTVTDIMVNGPTDIYVEREGKLEKVDVRFRDREHISAIAQKIASSVGRRIDEASPMVDARLADGSRVNVVFPPLALDSPCISIRKFSRRRFTIENLVANGSMTPSIARLLEIAARSRLNILVSGGTGSGKTTLLNAMSQMIDNRERIITIEDAAELQLQQPHVVRMETRPPNLEGAGEVTQRGLVRNSLRMRPDRIIVGEVRGPEAFDMLQAMNTGHDGSISTIHANSARDAMTRIENMVLMGYFNLPLRAIRAQITSALDLIVQVERLRDGSRRVTQIAEVGTLEGDVITMNDIAFFEYIGEDQHGRVLGKFRSSRGRPDFMPRLQYFGLDRMWLEALQGV